MSNVVIDFLSFVISTFMSYSYIAIKALYPYFRDFMIDCKDLFSYCGEDLLSVFFDDSNVSSLFNVNIIYWAFGVMVVFHLFKNYLWKLFVALYQAIADLLTPM